MNESTTIDLTVMDNQIHVQVHCRFAEPANTFTFSINALLALDGISGANGGLAWKTGRKYQPLYRSLVNEYIVTSDVPFNSLTIRYHGGINGWCNSIEKKRTALSFYSAWHPQETSIPLPNPIVRIHDMQDYLVLNARFDAGNRVWIYGEQDYDCANIIALRRGGYFEASEGNFHFYYLSEEEAEAANCLAFYFHDIFEYYSRMLYSPKEIKQMNLVSLSLPESSGAYFRKELIVLSRLNWDEASAQSTRINMAHLMAHELAHNWCTGADCNSWEDWLNETTAEWSALLYALDRDEKALFDQTIASIVKNYGQYPPIKTEDLSRPDGVHDKGTALFHHVYNRYGRDTIRKMLLAFVYLEDKATERYLEELDRKVGMEIADIVRRGLTMQLYDDLR